VDYRTVITPLYVQEAEAAERRRQDAIRRAKYGNAPVANVAPTDEQGHRSNGTKIGGVGRIPYFAIVRPKALADYDRLRDTDPDAYQGELYEAVADLHNVSAKTVRNWVNARNAERRGTA
jgi:hypothetical protein